MKADIIRLADIIIKYSSGDNDNITPEAMMDNLNKLGYNDLSPEELKALDTVISRNMPTGD